MGRRVVQEVPFFRGWGGSWDTPYGRFFLGWYSDALLAHGARLVAAATSVFAAAAAPRCTLSTHAAPERSAADAGPAYGIMGLLPNGGAAPGQAPEGNQAPEHSAAGDVTTYSGRAQSGGRLWAE